MSHKTDFQTIPLGTHDVFRDVISWNDDTSKLWVDALNLRATSQDQIALRAHLIELAQLRPGDTVVEVGCGTGALLCDLACSVSPGGRAIGVEPQPALAKAALQRLSAAGYGSVGEVRYESAHRLSVECESAAVCLAQTVLIHLPDKILEQALFEMIRVVRRGGRVISVDQDGDTWVIDHPDRDLTRRIVRFNIDQRYADGWTGRRLRRFFRQAGLSHVEVHLWTHVDTNGESYLFGMAKRLAGAAAEVGVITPSERDEWVQQLHEVASAGNFFSSINYYACVGVRA
jgi:ubiquinone/menaquinone biosynthesis C-methylase UbiE